MDNSSHFNDVQEMDCIAFSCFMLYETEMMIKIYRQLGLPQEDFWTQFHQQLCQNITTWMRDEDDHFFYDRRLDNDHFQKVQSAASFLPLMVGACSPEQADALLQHMQKPATFGPVFGVPTIAKTDPSYGTDMWRNPVWINYNYMIIVGLRRYGFNTAADNLTLSTIHEITRWYLVDGVFYEFYNDKARISPQRQNRKGQSIFPYNISAHIQTIRDYDWTSTLFAAMVLENPKLFLK